MEWYIPNFIVIDTIQKEENEYKKIYAIEQNSLVEVNEELFLLLQKLRERYGDSHLDTNDEDVKRLFCSECISKLETNRFISNERLNITTKIQSYVPHLTEVYFHISQECNLHCVYCYAHDNLGKGYVMNLSDAQSYIDKLYDLGVRNFIITGGEPLTNVNAVPILGYISSFKGTKVTLLTNGTLIEKYPKALEIADSIIISADVNGAKNRKGLDADKLFVDIQALSSTVKKKVNIRSVISKGEEKYIEEYKRKFNELGVKYITIPRLPNCSDDLRYLPNMYEMDKYTGLDLSTCKPTLCGAGRSEIAVDWNGDVYPCQNLMRPNLRITSLLSPMYKEELIQSRIVSSIAKANILNIEKCKNCDFRFVCGGGCRALALNVYGEVDHRLDFFCEYFKHDALTKLKAVVCH